MEIGNQLQNHKTETNTATPTSRFKQVSLGTYPLFITYFTKHFPVVFHGK